jgi:hypothetical protein
MYTPSFTRSRRFAYVSYLLVSASLIGCYGDPMISGVDPYAPTVFKEGNTIMPLVAPNPKTLLPFYVSETTIFKFAIDTQSILIGNDGVTRYMVQITSPSGSKQTQYEGIRCDSYQVRLYGTYETNGSWRENPLGGWSGIKDNIPNRYQAALAQGAICNLSSQVKSVNTVIQSLNPNSFIGGNQVPGFNSPN